MKARLKHACHALHNRIESQKKKHHEWLVSETFTAADVLVGFYLKWADSMMLLDEFDLLRDFAAACQSRPAFNPQ